MAYDDPIKFTVTEEHIKLLEHAWVSWNESGYQGTPTIDIKRPYGDSMITNSICEIFGWDIDDEDNFDKAFDLHRDMETVLQILIDNLREGIRSVVYTGEWNGKNWKRTEVV